MHPVLLEVKNEQKVRVLNIRALKSKSKDEAREDNGNVSYKTWRDLKYEKYDYRHTHIAYCEVRGKTREQIEKPAEKNEPDEDRIDDIKKDILGKIAAAALENVAA